MMFPTVLEQLALSYNLGFQKAAKDEVERFKSHLINTYNSVWKKNFKDTLNNENVMEKEFFKVRFTEALDLVRTRKVYLYQGKNHLYSFTLLLSRDRSQITLCIFHW